MDSNLDSVRLDLAFQELDEVTDLTVRSFVMRSSETVALSR